MNFALSGAKLNFCKSSMTRVITPSINKTGPPFGSNDEENAPRSWMSASKTCRLSGIRGFGSIGVCMVSPVANARGGGGGIHFGRTA